MPVAPASRVIGVIFLSITLLTSCASIEESTGISQETLGQMMGGVAGGLLGSAVTNDSLRPIAILLGAAGGAWLGGKVAKSLSEEDQIASEEVMAKTLETAERGEEVTWKSDTTSASGTFSAGEAHAEKRDVAIVRDVRVQELPPVELISKPYVALKSSNVRSRPSTDGNLVGALAPGESFTAVGKVIGKDWIMVAKNNVTVGFVYAPLVSPNTTVASNEKPKVRAAVNLDEMEADDGGVTPEAPVDGLALGGVDLDAMVVADNIEAETECRTLDYSITNEKDKTEKGEFEACKGSDGAWEIS